MIIVKRSGREEEFNATKLRRLAIWACADNKDMADALIDGTVNKLRTRTRSETLMRHLTETAANMISLINTDWQYVAEKLLLLDTYHARYPENEFHKDEYPLVEEVFHTGIYHKDLLGKYSEEELILINDMVQQDRDLIFTYSGLYYMFNKYAKPKELPQHVYMRVAMFLMQNEPDESRMVRVGALYDALSTHKITMATPVVLNAGMQRPQLSSCVLMEAGDDTESIMGTINNAAQYSRFHGGIAVNITSWRSRGSTIKGNLGHSSGPVAFVKMIESTIRAFSQGGARAGACVVTFDWWHKDAIDLIALKRNDGTDEERARHLKYTIRMNKFLYDAVRKDEEVYLFDPKLVPNLVTSWGDEWVKIYTKAIEDKIPHTKVPAKELMFEILKTRVETGNLYMFFTDNVNNQTPLKDRFIGASNLCTEIMQPTGAGTEEETAITLDLEGKHTMTTTRSPEEISLCTLASIDLYWYLNASPVERSVLAQQLVRALDNTFDLAHYPAKGAEWTTKRYRYIGIGVFNYAKMLASEKLHFNDPRSFELVKDVFKQLNADVYHASEVLAKERGPYPAYKLEHGAPRRNALLLSIAPTASSVRVVGGTESAEPIKDYFVRTEATISLPWIAPEFKQFRKYYDKAYDIAPEILLKHAALRQTWLDQAQSINMYLSGDYANSAKALNQLHEYALDLGIKSLYYCHTMKDEVEDICESCT